MLTPSIFDTPLWYTISSLKSMAHMRGSSNFRLRGGGGGVGQNLTENALSTFWSSNLSTVGSTSSTCLQCDQLSIYCTFWFKRVGVELNCLIPIELVIFKVSPGHLSPPASSLGLCMTDPSQNDCVSCLNHELC